MKTGRLRTMNICLSDLPKDKIYTAGNNKKYISLTTFDYSPDDERIKDADFSVSVTRTPQEENDKKPIVFLGSGCIHNIT